VSCRAGFVNFCSIHRYQTEVDERTMLVDLALCSSLIRLDECLQYQITGLITVYVAKVHETGPASQFVIASLYKQGRILIKNRRR